MEKVKMVMVLKGNNVSGREISEFLAKQRTKVFIAHEYALRLRDKILREMDYRAKYYAYNNIIPDLENTLVEVIRQAWLIAVGTDASGQNQSPPTARIQALKEVREAKQQLIDNLMNIGKLNKVPDKLAVWKRQEIEVKIPAEVLAAIECLEMQARPGPEPVRYIDSAPKELPMEKAEKKDAVEDKRQTVQFPGGTLSSEPDLP